MTNYKLTYFKWPNGLGQPIRTIFMNAKVPFEDVRIPLDMTTWSMKPELKEELGLTWGQVPILEFDGRKLAQSGAIMRYLAKKFDLYGRDDWEAAKCDEMADTLWDYMKHWQAFVPEEDPEKKEKLKDALFNVETPKYFSKFNTIIENNGGHLVGNSITWSEIFMAEMINNFDDYYKPAQSIAEDYPALKKMIHDVTSISGTTYVPSSE